MKLQSGGYDETLYNEIVISLLRGRVNSGACTETLDEKMAESAHRIAMEIIRLKTAAKNEPVSSSK